MDSRAIDFLSEVDLGTRVVVRSRVEGGFTDALGVLHSRTSSHCVIDTKRGLTTVAFELDVSALLSGLSHPG